MAPAEFFSKFGVYVQRNFLTEDDCRQIRAEMRAAPTESARVGLRGVGPNAAAVVEEYRKTSRAQVSAETNAALTARFIAARPYFEVYFNVPLADRMESAKYLIYRAGDFFLPHTDRRGPDELGPAISKLRRVNVVLYLNGEAEVPGPDVYAGGALTLYKLIPGQPWSPIGFPITGETGLLVCFRAELMHEVTPVLAGERFNIVTRYLDADLTLLDNENTPPGPRA